MFDIPIPFLGTFKEINLCFYVKRDERDSVKRGMVFINETVPYKSVAWLARKLYKEHYISIPTKNKIDINNSAKRICYEWKMNSAWNHLEVKAVAENTNMAPDSIKEFIFEHYYGYTKINSQLSREYKVNHPRLQVNKVTDYSINCDFIFMYGNNFSFLDNQSTDSVIIAEGSAVTVNCKRTSF